MYFPIPQLLSEWNFHPTILNHPKLTPNYQYEICSSHSCFIHLKAVSSEVALTCSRLHHHHMFGMSQKFPSMMFHQFISVTLKKKWRGKRHNISFPRYFLFSWTSSYWNCSFSFVNLFFHIIYMSIFQPIFQNNLYVLALSNFPDFL